MGQIHFLMLFVLDRNTSKLVSWVLHLIAFGGEIPILDLSGVWSTPSFPLLPGSLWPGVMVPDRIPSMSQIDLFKRFLNEIGIIDTI